VPPEFPGKRQAPVTEPSVLGALALGMEFLELKGALEALAGQLGAELTVEPADAPFLQPGREAHVLLGGQMAGWIGELHPLVLKEWDLEQAVAFELATAVLIERASSGHEQYEDVTSYPAVFQDIAVVVEEEVAAGAVREAVFAGGGELLRAAEVFDVYRGEQLEDGKKSLAMRLEFRWDEGTLTDEEVARYRESIRKSVEKVGGSLRE
jgi:phenylalanyl-tRNA synthetase beta chain